jgi:mycothiol synthase
MEVQPMHRVAAPARIELRTFDLTTDPEPIAELATRTNLADGTDWVLTADSLRVQFAAGGTHDPERDTRVALIDGVRVGFIDVNSRVRTPGRVVHRFDLLTWPEWRRRGVGRALLAWAEQRGRAMRDAGEPGGAGLPHVMSGGVNVENPFAAAFAQAMGYRRIRSSFLMRRPLDTPIPAAPLPPGLELRPVREADHRAIFDANNEAFRDHWESAERGDADFRSLFAEPALDTSLWAVAWDGDQVAGVSMNWIEPEENARVGIEAGWLGNVSVRRPWRRRGVGAAMIAASLRTFRERGLAEGRLGVDAENPTGALGLYERLGFSPFATFETYRKEL